MPGPSPTGVLIKNNHIAFGRAGSRQHWNVAPCNRGVRKLIEIEVRSPAELKQALEKGAEAVLLDIQMTVDDVKQAVTTVFAAGEAHSGGVLGRHYVGECCEPTPKLGVDFISVGALAPLGNGGGHGLRIAPA